MTTVDLTVNCCLCSNKHRTTIEMPAGWDHRYGGIDDETSGFCPDHAAVAPFAFSQCPGCVGGWGDCGMWRAFAHSHGRDIGPADFEALERGVCPRRVNGTSMIKDGAFQYLDLSELATVEAGKAFAKAIRDYCDQYPAKAA